MSESVGKIDQNIFVRIGRPNPSEFTSPNLSAKSVRIYLNKSFCQIVQNTLAKIRRPYRSEYTCPNQAAKSVKIYLSKTVGQISQNILFQICPQNFSEYRNIFVRKIGLNLYVQIRQPNRSEYSCPNRSAKSV